MKLRYVILFSLIGLSGVLTGCGSDATVNSNTANSNTANTVKTNANSPVAVTTPTPDQVNNNAPTLTPVYKAYCAAVVKKDDTAIRKFFTSDTLKSFEEGMKDEGIKKISEYVDKVTNEVCEVSNERIKGDKAVAKVKTVSYPNGFEVLFVNENGEWKMSNMDPAKGF